jgi:hypothetical protein
MEEKEEKFGSLSMDDSSIPILPRNLPLKNPLKFRENFQ